MGCQQSNFKNIEHEGPEENFDDFNEISKIPGVDARLPLNVRQTFKLRQSWKGIKRKTEETGVEMFVR